MARVHAHLSQRINAQDSVRKSIFNDDEAGASFSETIIAIRKNDPRVMEQRRGERKGFEGIQMISICIH